MRGWARFTIPCSDAKRSTSAAVTEVMSMQSMVAAGVENAGRNRLVGQERPVPRASLSREKESNETRTEMAVRRLLRGQVVGRKCKLGIGVKKKDRESVCPGRRV